MYLLLNIRENLNYNGNVKGRRRHLHYDDVDHDDGTAQSQLGSEN